MEIKFIAPVEGLFSREELLTIYLCFFNLIEKKLEKKLYCYSEVSESAV